MPNPIAAKITEKHIDKILDIAEKDDAVFLGGLGSGFGIKSYMERKK